MIFLTPEEEIIFKLTEHEAYVRFKDIVDEITYSRRFNGTRNVRRYGLAITKCEINFCGQIGCDKCRGKSGEFGIRCESLGSVVCVVSWQGMNTLHVQRLAIFGNDLKPLVQTIPSRSRLERFMEQDYPFEKANRILVCGY